MTITDFINTYFDIKLIGDGASLDKLDSVKEFILEDYSEVSRVINSIFINTFAKKNKSIVLVPNFPPMKQFKPSEALASIWLLDDLRIMGCCNIKQIFPQEFEEIYNLLILFKNIEKQFFIDPSASFLLQDILVKINIKAELLFSRLDLEKLEPSLYKSQFVNAINSMLDTLKEVSLHAEQVFLINPCSLLVREWQIDYFEGLKSRNVIVVSLKPHIIKTTLSEKMDNLMKKIQQIPGILPPKKLQSIHFKMD